MKTIRIQALELINFKGIRHFSLDLAKTTGQISIYARNGAGKTSLFDSFTWLLFGKDSQDRKQFDIKTLDEKGEAIPRIPHEVKATLLVDGEEVRLCRRYVEKWTKKRGESEEMLTGHEEERFYNDVPCSLKEWNEKIEGICTEELFKFITSPSYFVNQKTEAQRELLLQMAGSLSDEEIAEGKEEFQTLLGKLTGKSLEEYKKEIQAKKKRIKEELRGLPERIDECERMNENSLDFTAIRSEIEAKESELASIQERINDKSKRILEEDKTREEKARKIGALRQERASLINKFSEEAQKEYLENKQAREESSHKLDSFIKEQSKLQKEIQELKDKETSLKEKREELLQEYKEITNRELAFSDKDCICPTCKRSLEVEDIEAKQEEIRQRFNKKQAQDKADNIAKGKAIKSQTEEIQEQIEKKTNQLKETERSYLEAEKAFAQLPQVEKPQLDGSFDHLEEVQSLSQRIQALEEELERDNQRECDSEDKKLQDRKGELEGELKNLRGELSKEEAQKRNKSRIFELKQQLSLQSEELAKLEGQEYSIEAFSKAKIERVQERIDRLFSIVSFKMFKTQINGAVVETCEATIKGKPYATLSNSEQINCGLDIVNAISQHFGLSAPIFVDNAESANSLLETIGQQIRLYVSTEDKLTIKE